MQTVMINMSVIPWVVGLLENTDSLSDYTLEYAVALCMNLCLRASGKRNCLLISQRILKVLIELLNCENIDIVPYEDAPTLESDLDRQDLPPPDPSDLKSLTGPEAMLRDPRLWVGEGLLKSHYAVEPTVRGEANGGVDWCKPMLSRDNEARMSLTSVKSMSVLRRPATPSQRSARVSISESRPSTASKLGRNADVPVPVTEESSHPLYLRDSLATLAQSFSEDATPRSSTQLDSGQLRNILTDLQRQQEHTEGSQNELQSHPFQTSLSSTQGPNKSSIPSKGSRTSVGTKRSAFESRPKIPRTPDAMSPTHRKPDTCQSPDSTVSSTHSSGASERNDSRSTIRNSRPPSHLSDRQASEAAVKQSSENVRKSSSLDPDEKLFPVRQLHTLVVRQARLFHIELGSEIQVAHSKT
ncbi:unnamed protein product [Echinostoma caproni]|uniref:ARMC9 n=1 Tax=Echinostoma caproni TaxID=27848 RepID=A0A183ANS3_9TREM|nr:unnamed protein product [Echinostoma caproni]